MNTEKKIEAYRNIRARDLNISFQGVTGVYNAITDVKGVEVGYSTIIKDLNSGTKIRTGVTAILPRGKINDPVFANWFALNGNGEMTGTTWITESGFLETPILITNTNSVGIARDTMLQWFIENNWYTENHWYIYPVVGETYDGFLNDINGFHVMKEHVFEALNNTSNSEIKEGNVGGGTGMISFGFKGGTGTSSRIVDINGKKYTLGVLVQSNFGVRENLSICGVPVGKELLNEKPPQLNLSNTHFSQGDGSIIVVVATDAPLLPHQLKRIATRVSLGIGSVGGKGANGSGDIFITFSTANKNAFDRKDNVTVEQISNDQINPLFIATVQCVEESIINSMIAAETLQGMNDSIVYALPHDSLKRIMKKYSMV